MIIWRCQPNGMFLESDLTPDEFRMIKSRMDQLANHQRNNPKAIVTTLFAELNNKFITIRTLQQFSKWCDWEDPSEYDALKLSEALFNGVRLPRLKDQGNHKNSDYEIMLNIFYKNVQKSNPSPETIED